MYMYCMYSIRCLEKLVKEFNEALIYVVVIYTYEDGRFTKLASSFIFYFGFCSLLLFHYLLLLLEQE